MYISVMCIYATGSEFLLSPKETITTYTPVLNRGKKRESFLSLTVTSLYSV